MQNDCIIGPDILHLIFENFHVSVHLQGKIRSVENFRHCGLHAFQTNFCLCQLIKIIHWVHKQYKLIWTLSTWEDTEVLMLQSLSLRNNDVSSQLNLAIKTENLLTMKLGPDFLFLVHCYKREAIPLLSNHLNFV